MWAWSAGSRAGSGDSSAQVTDDAENAVADCVDAVNSADAVEVAVAHSADAVEVAFAAEDVDADSVDAGAVAEYDFAVDAAVLLMLWIRQITLLIMLMPWMLQM